ncbi:MAG: adenylate kinase [Bacteroidales bacterium]|nr:adenylate kinase [Bacteroidales bacterium]
MFNLVLLGPPGCGKGTQAQIIKEHFHFIHLSTGDLIREEIRKGTVAGQKFLKFTQQGLLVPDDMILKEVWKFARKHEKVRGIIFDGFPRTLYQAIMLDKVFQKKGYQIHLVLAIDVPEEVLIQRILKRAQVSGREDDNEFVAKNRLLVYYSHTQPVIDYYRKKNILKEIDGNKTIEEVFAEISSHIQEELEEYERKQFH